MKMLVSSSALALVVMAGPSAVTAQTLELSPMAGYRIGGEICSGCTALFDRDMEIESSSSFGLNLGLVLSDHSQIELVGSHQGTELTDSKLFEPEVDRVEVDITYFHVGYLYQWTPGRVRPYVSGSLGLTTLDPEVAGLSSEDRFSVSVGGGVKVMASEHVGFRLDGRLFWTDTGGLRRNSHWDDWEDCRDSCYEWDTDLLQHEVKVGLVLLF